MMAVTATMIATWMAVFFENCGFALLDESACVVSGVVLMLGFASNLIGALTHYASGPAGLIYGSGFVKTAEWFRVSFIASVINIVIFGVVGTAWLALLGMMG